MKHTAPAEQKSAPPLPPTKTFVLAGLLVFLLFFGGFGLWAATAPLSSAAIAPGTVRVESQRKTVQHLEGGIIDDLLVREGEVVQRGQILVVLDRTQAASRRDALRNQYISLQAEKARLLAERDGAERIEFPRELESARAERRIAEVLAGQEQIFATQRQSLRRQVSILERRIDQLQSQIDGLEAQIDAEQQQLQLIRQETQDVQSLFDKGLERKARLLALQRETARLEGLKADHFAQIARASQAIGEAELQILGLQDRLDASVASDLEEVERKLVDTEEELRAAEDVLNRREIRAPTTGTVINLRFFTTDGVIEPGAPVLDIVPQHDRLIIEAEVSPLDIDVVSAGLDAQVRLTAFKLRNAPMLKGHVIQVSADRLVNERTGSAYYSALIEIDGPEVERVDGLALYPGMPAEVIVETGKRTLLQYLAQPVGDSFVRAFREQ